MRFSGVVMALAFVCHGLLLAVDENQTDWPLAKFEASVLELEVPAGWYVEEIPTVEMNSRGEIFVFHRGRHNLLKFTREGRFICEIGQGLFKVPHGLRIDGEDRIWTTDQETHQAIRFETDGRVSLVLGRRNLASPGWFERGYNVMMLDQPSDVAWDSEGNLYVADGGNFRIVKYDPNGEPITSWGKKGSAPGEFDFPHSMVVDKKDRIYVSDRENGRIQWFSKDGAFLGQWEHIGNPYVMILAPDETIWMTDARAGRLLNLGSDGQVLKSYGQWGKEVGDFGFGHGLCLTPQGELYVSEILNWRIQKLSPIE